MVCPAEVGVIPRVIRPSFQRGALDRTAYENALPSIVSRTRPWQNTRSSLRSDDSGLARNDGDLLGFGDGLCRFFAVTEAVAGAEIVSELQFHAHVVVLASDH